jgi:glycosyltransferase involved in cell wall biosynthesis
METLNICLISPTIYRLPLDSYGGIEYLIQMHAENLAKLGHCVDCYAPMGSTLKGVNVIETVQPRSDLNQEDIQFNMMKTFPLNGYSIIEDNTHQFWIYMHPDADELPITSVLHNPTHFRTSPPVRYPNIITISKNSQKLLKQITGLDSRMVYNCINLSKYEYRKDKSDELLFFSRFDSAKGAHTAIDIARLAKHKINLAGEHEFVPNPKYVEHLKRICNKLDFVKYWGRVTNDLQRELFADAKALVLPTWEGEPFGIVMIEAMASGTPVISYDWGVMPELIVDGKTGFLCGSEEEMVEAVDRIDEINPEDCLEQAKKFSDDIRTNELLRCYKDIMDGNRW